MNVVINPGSGPVGGADSDHARANMRQFVMDLGLNAEQVELISGPGREDAGRWLFVVRVDGIEHEVEMPGIPLDQVRWMDEAGQNIWHFPRLYVDGSSWVWLFALGACERDEADA